MVWLPRILLALVAAAGGAATSQFPEFAQQYRQRLGGALDELRAVVADFDADARRNGLVREEAVAAMRESADRLVRDRAISVTAMLDRHAALERQNAALQSAPALIRPVHVLRHPDRRVVHGTWEAFEPAVPVTSTGLAWGVAGLALAAGLARLCGSAGRRLIAALRPARPAGDSAPPAGRR